MSFDVPKYCTVYIFISLLIGANMNIKQKHFDPCLNYNPKNKAKTSKFSLTHKLLPNNLIPLVTTFNFTKYQTYYTFQNKMWY